MRILRIGLWVESLKRIGKKPHLNNLIDSLVLGRCIALEDYIANKICIKNRLLVKLIHKTGFV